MQKLRVTRRFIELRYSLASVLSVLLLSAALLPAASAIEVPGLYTAEVRLDGDADDPRKDAYERALAEILLRVSGSGLSSDTVLKEQLFPDPAIYVMQFRPGANESLWVSFDGQAIERTLREAGQSVWGAERPLTLVWLAVDWGQGSREIISADDPDRSDSQSRSIDRNKQLRQRMLEIAARRGLPLVFPLLDTIDLQGVTFSDIWGGFDERIIDASERYQAESILIGKIRPSSAGQESWSYYFSGVERSWNGPPEVVVARIADLLASEFAVSNDAPVSTVSLRVSGVATLEAYGSMQKLLAGVSLVENFVVAEVAGDRVSYRVDVRGGAERLRGALRFNGLVEQESAFVSDGNGAVPELEFFYSR